MKVLVTEKLSEHKFKTPEGYLICVDAILARTGKQQYRKSEIWGDSVENADELVDVDRTEDEVFNDKTLASFENKPITVEHPDEDVNSENYKTYTVGFVRDVKRGKTADGQDVMLGTLVIQDAQTISEIENGEHTDLSCGYDCDIQDEANPKQTNIRGNHVALCQEGRAGIARIVDSKTNDNYYGNVEESKLRASKDFKLKEYFKRLDELKKQPISVRQELDIRDIKALIEKRVKQLKTVPNDIYDSIVQDKLAKATFTIKSLSTYGGDTGDRYTDDYKAYTLSEAWESWKKDHSPGWANYRILDIHKVDANGTERYPHMIGRTKDIDELVKKFKDSVKDTEIEDTDERIKVGDASVHASSEHNNVNNNWYGYYMVEHPKYGTFYVSVKTKGRKQEVQLDGTGWNFIKSKGYTAEQKRWIAQHKSDIERLGPGGTVADSTNDVEDAADLSGLYKNNDDDAIKVTRNGFSYNVQFGEDYIFNKGWSYPRSYDSIHLSRYIRQNRLMKVSKLKYLTDSVEDNNEIVKLQKELDSIYDDIEYAEDHNDYWTKSRLLKEAKKIENRIAELQKKPNKTTNDSKMTDEKAASIIKMFKAAKRIASIEIDKTSDSTKEINK